MIEDPFKEKRKRFTYTYLVLSCFFILAIFLYWLLIWRYYEYTNDAYVEGNQVFITPLKPGFITAIHTDDTYLVKKGQLLIELDQTDSIIALEQAEKQLANVVRDVCQMFHQVFTLQAEIEVKKAELIKLGEDYKHRHDLLPSEGISLEDYQHALAALRAGYYSLKMSETLYDKSFASIQGTSISSHPLVLASADNVRNAWVQLHRCRIYSSVDGLAAQRTIQVGMWVEEGRPLLSVIPLDQIWVNANYKETQLKHMRIGQSVRLTADLYGDDVTFHGKIVGLPGGAGNVFSLLPPQNLSGNWIKIVQRLPVRVSLAPSDLEKYPLRLGLSMEALVDLHETQGLLIPETSEGSPLYETAIFQKEEEGDLKAIACIIEKNIDPLLIPYASSCLQYNKQDPDPLILEYLLQSEKEKS